MKRYLALFLAVVLATAQFVGYIPAKAAGESHVLTPSYMKDGQVASVTQQTTFLDTDVLQVTPDAASADDIMLDNWSIGNYGLSAGDYKYVSVDYYYEQKTGGSWHGWEIAGQYVDDKAESDSVETTIGPAVVDYDKNIVGDSNPTYMAKIHANNWMDMIQQVFGYEQGATYTFSVDYYMPEGSNGSIRLRGGSGTPQISQKDIAGGTKGTVTLTHTMTAADMEWFEVDIVQHAGTGYYWNPSFTKAGSNENLLKNADFAKEGGSWVDWKINYQPVDDKAESDSFAAYGEIVTYDTAIGGDTNPKYMVKLTDSYMNSTGQTYTWVDTWQNMISKVKSNTTYVFTCDYYMPANAVGSIRFRGGANSQTISPETVLYGGEAGTRGTATVEYTMGDKSNISWFGPCLVQHNPGGVGYYWNLRVTEKGSDVNLLDNADFTMDDAKNAPDNMVIRLCEKGDSANTWSTWKPSENAIVANQWATMTFDVSDFNMSNDYCQMHFFPWGQGAYSKGNTAEGTMYIKNITFYTDSNDDGGGTGGDEGGTGDEGGSGNEGGSTSAIPSGDPVYMAKLIGSYVDANGMTQTWKEIHQNITVEAGKTYEFSYSYYVPDEGEVYGRIMGEGWTILKQDVSVVGEVKTVKLTYTTTASDEWLAPLISKNDKGTAYVWNLCFNEVGGDVNLLCNADFSESDGTWIGWDVGGVKPTDKSGSDSVTNSFGHAIMAFDKTLWEDEGNEGGSEDEGGTGSEGGSTSAIPSGDPVYMAKLIGSYVDANGTTQTWKEIHQNITVEAGKTYEFSYSYYVPDEGEVYGRIMGAGWKILKQDVSVVGEVKSVKLTYTTTESDEWLAPLLSKNDKGKAYVWNLCFKEVDGNVNLLRNADFSEGDGSWIGWDVGGIKPKDKVGSANVSTSFGHAIVKFDSALFKQEVKTSAIPTGDPKYMAKMIGTYVDGNGVTQQWKELFQNIFEIKAGTTYEFSFDYYVPGAGCVEGRIMGDGWVILEKAVSETGEVGTIKISYTAKAGETWLAPLVSKDTEGIAYVWNLCFKEADGKVNLLANADFAKEDGSWIGWNIGSTKPMDKASSDSITTSFGHEIIKFDRALFEKEKGNASALNSAFNPNSNLDIAENGKYKELDTWVNETVEDVQDEVQKQDANGIKLVLGVVSTSLLIGVAVVIILAKKKSNKK